MWLLICPAVLSSVSRQQARIVASKSQAKGGKGILVPSSEIEGRQIREGRLSHGRSPRVGDTGKMRVRKELIIITSFIYIMTGGAT